MSSFIVIKDKYSMMTVTILNQNVYLDAVHLGLNVAFIAILLRNQIAPTMM